MEIYKKFLDQAVGRKFLEILKDPEVSQELWENRTNV